MTSSLILSTGGGHLLSNKKHTRGISGWTEKFIQALDYYENVDLYMLIFCVLQVKIK